MPPDSLIDIQAFARVRQARTAAELVNVRRDEWITSVAARGAEGTPYERLLHKMLLDAQAKRAAMDAATEADALSLDLIAMTQGVA